MVGQGADKSPLRWPPSRRCHSLHPTATSRLAIVDAYKEYPGNPRYAFRHPLFSVTDPSRRVKPVAASDIMWAEAMGKLECMDSADRKRLWPHLVQGFKDLSNRFKVYWKSIEEAKAELLRQLMREDAAADGEKTTARRTEELVGFLRRQIQHDAPGERADKHLLLSLLVRAARAEEKLSEETPRVELLEKRMGMTCLGLVFSVFVVFFGLPAIVALHLIVKLLRLVF
nr:unnamed protein product [Digitaria exilis]